MRLTFYTVDSYCDSIDRRSGTICVDLTDLDFITQYALVYIGLFIRQKRQASCEIDFKRPKSRLVADYLEKQNFFNRFEIVAPSSQFDDLLYSLSLTDVEKRPGLTDEYIEALRRLLINLRVRTDIAKFCEVSGEILDNFVVHSEDRLGVIGFQYLPKNEEIGICFGDCGIGFRRSLSKNRKYTNLLKLPSAYAIAEAVKEGISRFDERRGSGLAMLLEYVLEKHGDLYITSEDGYFRLDRNGNPKLGAMSYNLPGVQIEFVIEDK